jgi:hypothetical protein
MVDRYLPEPGSLLTVSYSDDSETAAVWKIVKYLSRDRVRVELVVGSHKFMHRANKYGNVNPGFSITISSLNLEPANEMLTLALFAL